MPSGNSSAASTADSRVTGLLFAMGAAITWSAAGVGIKLLPLSGPSISGLRALFALPVLALALVLRAQVARDPAFYRYALRKWTVWACAAAYATCVTTFVLATKLTTAANAILFQYSAPIYTAILSWPLLGERVRGSDWLAVLGCLIGIAWCFSAKISTGGAAGNALALGSGLCFALIPLLWRLQLKAAMRQDESGQSQKYGPHLIELTLVCGNLLTAIVALPFVLRDLPKTPGTWLGVALLGAVQIGIAYLLYSAAVRRLRAVDSMLAATLEPILNPLWVALWAHEHPAPQTLIGGAIILITVILHGLYTSTLRRT